MEEERQGSVIDWLWQWEEDSEDGETVPMVLLGHG